MTFEEFMNLKRGDKVVFENGKTGFVASRRDIKKGERDCTDGMVSIAKLNMRSVAIVYEDFWGLDKYLHPTIYVDFPDCIHNQCVLSNFSRFEEGPQ